MDKRFQTTDKRFQTTDVVLNMEGADIKTLLNFIVSNKNGKFIQDCEGRIISYGNNCGMTIFWSCVDGCNVAFVESSGAITDHEALEAKLKQLFPDKTIISTDEICYRGPFAKYINSN